MERERGRKPAHSADNAIDAGEPTLHPPANRAEASRIETLRLEQITFV